MHRFDTHFRYHPQKGKLDLENWCIFTSSKNVPNLFPELPVNGNFHLFSGEARDILLRHSSIAQFYRSFYEKPYF